MNLLQRTIKVCQNYNIKPHRSRGQNFLINSKIYQNIIKAADLNNSDVILEVGPGLGFLTELIAPKVKQVIAVELDDKLFAFLQGSLSEQGIKNVDVFNDNILHFQHRLFNSADSYKIVANLPYNISSRFIRRFLSEIDNKPSDMILMLQREVAERLTAKPGQMSLLALSAQYYADIEVLFSVNKNEFWPAPKVTSAIVHLKKHKYKDNAEQVNVEKMFAIAHAGFSSKRKQLQGNLATHFKIPAHEIKKSLHSIGLPEKVRAQELSVEDWKKLTMILNV